MQVKLSPSDFTSVFEPILSSYVKRRIITYGFVHEELSKDEYEQCLDKIMSTLNGPMIKAGEERQKQWDDGWEENLNSNDITPKYFGKYDILRWKQSLVRPVSLNYEVNMLHLIVDWIADKYMRDAYRICEFGCGTGHNLQHIRVVNPSATLVGLDWAGSACQLVNKYAEESGDSDLFARQFDFFHPDYSFSDIGNVIYTVAALEQTGDRFKPFVDYLLHYKPNLCIHIEPIGELLNKENTLDRLSLKYFEKRNYLSGFLTYLKCLESQGLIEIERAQRTYIGSLFIEGYSIVVWKPKFKNNE